MTKATTAGIVGDVEQFRAEHPNEGLLAAEAIEGASADPMTDETETTSPGWDASAMPKRDQLEAMEETKDKLLEQAEDTKDDLIEQAEDTKEKLMEQAESYVVANPLKAVAAGLVAGVVLGRML